MKTFRLVYGISGASGIPLASAILTHFAQIEPLEIHLVISRAAKLVMDAEQPEGAMSLARLACALYEPENLAAPPASGSWLWDGMIVCPCSLNTLAAVAAGFAANLLQRACAVSLKERRPLLLAPRETPLSLIAIRNMATVSEAGGIIMPFSPVFYSGVDSLEKAMAQYAGHMLDVLKIPNNLRRRWTETD